MKFILAMAVAFIATAANAAPFPEAASAQADSASSLRYYLFITYFTSSGVTTPIELGPFLTEKACSNAAALLDAKVAVGASACLKNQ